MHNYKTIIIQLTLWLAFATTFVSGQKPAKVKVVIEKETNAVLIAALVRDPATGEPVTNLRAEDAAPPAENGAAAIADFSFDGQTNCPLTIFIYLNFAPNGAMRYLEGPKSQKSLRKTLTHPGEEAAIAAPPPAE